MTKIPIYKPFLKKYKCSALDAVESEWISNHGKYIELATNKFKQILNAKYVILMNNGTTSTHCLFLSLKYKYPEIKKIYVPNNVYVAVYNCALMTYPDEYLEVMKINENTWNMEENDEYLLSLEKNSAIVIVHNLGGIIDVDRIKKIRPDIILVEDNCEGLFGKYNNKYTGTSENILCSSVSFYGNKTITTGEGGAFITSDDDVYNYIKKVYTQGMSEKRFVHNIHAYNYRMTNIQAAFLYEQLNDIDTILNMKKNIFDNYIKLLENEINENKISLQKINFNSERANWMFTVKLNNNDMTIDEFNEYFTNQNNIEIRPFFYPFKSHNHLINLNSHSNDDISNKLNSNIIMLPSYPELEFKEQEYICKILKNIL
jgi:perosamine synthetase